MSRLMSDAEVFASPSPSSLLHCDYSDWSPSFSIIPAVYLLVFVVGCLGNGLVLWAYLDQAEVRRGGSGSRRLCCMTLASGMSDIAGAERCRRAPLPRPSRSLTDSLIASLALADLCFLVTLPLWAVYTALGYHWPFGQPLCKLSSFLTALNMYASVFSLGALGAERYRVLMGCRRSGRPGRHGGRILGGLWALAGILALPGFLLRSVQEVELHPEEAGPTLFSCQMDYSLLIGQELDEAARERAELVWAAALSLKSTLIGFLLPLAVLLVCYCSLARLLGRHFGGGAHPDRPRQRRLLRIIVTLVMAFFLCWLPLHVNKTLSLLLELGCIPFSCALDRALLAAQPYVTCLAYLNSCLNPALYAACDPALRRRCRQRLHPLCGERQGGGEGGAEGQGREAAGGEGMPEETAGGTEEEGIGQVVTEG